MPAFGTIFAQDFSSGTYGLRDLNTVITDAITDTPTSAVITGHDGTITVNNISSFLGLFDTAVYVSNLTVAMTGITRLASNAGWFFKSFSSSSDGLTATATNCHSTGPIGSPGTPNNRGCGGIFGASAGINGGLATATNCSSTGNIHDRGGGIFGQNAGQAINSSGSAIANNCHSTGNIGTTATGLIDGNGDGAGGIFGRNAAITLSTATGNATANYCYSSGTTMTMLTGGIFGQLAGSGGGIANANNCYRTGDIGGAGAGGIFGAGAGLAGGTTTATNCYSIGTTVGTGAGGIFGQTSGSSGSSSAINCYITGFIGQEAGGIFGQNAASTSGSGFATATDCYSDATIGVGAGGIFGQNAGRNTAHAHATNCYSTGTINNVGAGGIFGQGAGLTSTVVIAENCYSLGSITGVGAGGIFGQNANPSNTITTCYIAAGGWSDTAATLTGKPTSTPGSGTVWVSSAANTPYTLKSFVILCFKENTLILSMVDKREKYVPVQNLRKGDLVKTLKNGYIPISIIGSSTVYNSGNNDRIKDRLYRLPKKDYPTLTDDLILTGAHSILIDYITSYEQRQAIIAAFGNIYSTDGKYRMMTVTDDRAVPYEKTGVFRIWNFALEADTPSRNYGVYANGLLVECSFEIHLRPTNHIN